MSLAKLILAFHLNESNPYFLVPNHRPARQTRTREGCAYDDGVTFNYPYNSSEYDTVNMNLSVINYPDCLGTACGYSPFSFYLGGKRTYWGLPNNPDYDLGPLASSPCDTLVGIGEFPAINSAAIHVFYHSSWEKVFINASDLKGNDGVLMMYDMQGKVIYSEDMRIQNGYYTKDLSMIGIAKGKYVVVVQTEKDQLVKKFVIE